jgi:DNA topoisomerase-1
VAQGTVEGASTSADEKFATAARAVGLRYSSDERPGILRKRKGKGFTYVGPEGRTVKDKRTLTRIKALGIPPAYTDVWITTDPRGHVQATGRDAKGRKQYRYHPRWHETRDETKFERMVDFGQALPIIRERTAADLRRKGLPREKVLAAVVQLLEKTLIRVGNQEYARENKSYGLTTLRDRHVKVGEKRLRFRFRGKSGIEHEITLSDPRLARVVKRCRELPGQELFQYLDEDGQRHTIESDDVNEYLREISGQEFTAKDFRTWAGTVLCSLALREFDACLSEAQAKKNVVAAVKRVAERLGNTPAVCRKSYIHPAILDAYLDGTIVQALHDFAARGKGDEDAGLDTAERALLALLQERADMGR